MPTLKLKLSRHKHRKPIYRPPTPDPRKPYHAPSLYARVLAKLLSKNQIRELQEAQRLFELRADPGAAAACASMCYEIVDERPSEAVAARAHGMLAVKGVGGLADARRYHASEAVDCWRRVINRTGRSRFDVEKARVELRGAEGLLRQAEVDCVEYEETAATMLC